MKKILFITLLLTYVYKGCAQITVIKIFGSVFVGKNGDKELRPLNQIKSNEKLWFTTLDDRIYVYNKSSNKSCWLTPNPKQLKPKNKLKQLLSFSLHFESTSGTLSGRGTGLIIEKIPGALQTNSNSNGKIIIEKINKFIFDPIEFPQTNGSGFFIQIDSLQKKGKPKGLKSSGDTLFINNTDITVQKINQDIKYSLGYYNKSATKSILVATFNPYIDRDSELEGLISNLIYVYRPENMSKEAIRDSVYLNVYDIIGKPNGILFLDLFNRYWGKNDSAKK